MESYFTKLNQINVNGKIEKKNGLSYLSWAWAWETLKKEFPTANYKVYERENGCIYWDDGKTAWVKTGVIVEGIEHIEYLPIMDFKNKSIPLDNITSFDINKAIQRSLTKAISRHGLGLYIYAGEDLPEAEKEEKPQAPIMSQINPKVKADTMKKLIIFARKQKDYSNLEVKDLPNFFNNLTGGDLKTCTEAEILEAMK
jgi:hypothetical protein